MRISESEQKGMQSSLHFKFLISLKVIILVLVNQLSSIVMKSQISTDLLDLVQALGIARCWSRETDLQKPFREFFVEFRWKKEPLHFNPLP